MKTWLDLAREIETIFERVMFASRWLLAPFYFGLAISVAVLLVKFAIELAHIVTHAFTSTESDVIVGVLSLVDFALVGSLLIIVIFSGYENFVSKIDHSSHKDWPEWMGTIDFTGLKLKLMSSIVAISAIQLLKQFMSIRTAPKDDLMWLVIVHVVFVVSSLLLALSDRISAHRDEPAHHPAGGDGAERTAEAAKPAGAQNTDAKPKPSVRK